MSEGYGITIADDRDIDASPLELVNECLVILTRGFFCFYRDILSSCP